MSFLTQRLAGEPRAWPESQLIHSTEFSLLLECETHGWGQDTHAPSGHETSSMKWSWPRKPCWSAFMANQEPGAALVSRNQNWLFIDLSKYQRCNVFIWFTILFTIFKLSGALNIQEKPHQTKDILGTCYVCCTAERFVVPMISKFCNRSISVLPFSPIDHPMIIAFSLLLRDGVFINISAVVKQKQSRPCLILFALIVEMRLGGLASQHTS